MRLALPHLIVVVSVGLAMPLSGQAQQAPPPAPAAQSGSQAEMTMMAAMAKMSQTMAAVPMTGNPDRDFVAMMIPHHQGAIDMARFELANGKDPVMRKLAAAIVSAQENEIKEMRSWQQATLGKH